MLKLIDQLMLLDMLQRMLKLSLALSNSRAALSNSRGATDGSGTGTKTSLDAGTFSATDAGGFDLYLDLGMDL